MANKNLFNTKVNKIASIGVANTVNNASGKAYELSDENALAQLVVTGTLSNTYYARADEQLDKTLELAGKCSDEFVAKVAVYGHTVAHMKDTPALLLAVLSTRNNELFKKTFNKVVTNQKMLRNFVQIVRSGKVGRKSFGTVAKKQIQKWLAGQNSNNLFKGAVGNDPSLADVVKMTHPKPENEEKHAFYGWLLGKKYDEGALPCSVKTFEEFKKGGKEIPNCDFRMLTSFLTPEKWKTVALNMPWNALRMNINTISRNAVFKDEYCLKKICEKLQDKAEIKKNNAFPYQLLTTFQNIDVDTPNCLRLSLEIAMEHATENVPLLKGKTVICVDTSGSMSNPVTNNGVVASKTRYIDIAALFATSLSKTNEDVIVVPFDTKVHEYSYNRFESVMNRATKLASYGGGGTDVSCAVKYLNNKHIKADNVIFVSDNESWYNSSRGYGFGYGRTSLVNEWETFKKNNRNAKLVCIDICPNTTTQIPNLPKEVLNIGGFSDNVWPTIERFINKEDVNFASVIRESVNLD